MLHWLLGDIVAYLWQIKSSDGEILHEKLPRESLEVAAI
jgi:hypothetical protein